MEYVLIFVFLCLDLSGDVLNDKVARQTLGQLLCRLHSVVAV